MIISQALKLRLPVLLNSDESTCKILLKSTTADKLVNILQTISHGEQAYLEVVEAIPGPNGDLARRVALVELEIHVGHNKLPRNIEPINLKTIGITRQSEYSISTEAGTCSCTFFWNWMFTRCGCAPSDLRPKSQNPNHQL
jgi:hypothetical protein